MLHLPKIAIINKSTVLDDASCRQISAAGQKQVSDDFAPAWGQDAIISFFDEREIPPQSWWQIAFLDDSDQAGALGYHDLSPKDQPIAFVFAKTDLAYGLKSSVTFSHELLEMLADPWICATALKQSSARSGDTYSLEVCDPVEADELGYEIDGQQMSDFVLPDYFRDGADGPFSFKNHVSAPFQLARGGYLSRFVQGQGWGQINAAAAPDTARQAARKARGAFTRTQTRAMRGSQ